MKKILPPVLFLIFALAMGVICWGFGFTHFIRYPYNVFGLPLLVGGLFLAQASKKMFIRRKTNVHTFDQPDQLITEGFFRYSRNPMYLGFVLALSGIAVLYQGAISSFILVFIFFVITDQWYIRFEERMMRDKFGQAYQEYRQHTRRWI
jgi:protein-S-isoprenylcysteine O-methyltransferase Ste14